MRSVAVMSRKGGSGKTTISHLLSLGAVWNDLPAYLLHTDDRDPITAIGRPYEYLDAREIDKLIKYYNHLQKPHIPGLIVLDSGGNRPKFDAWIGEHVDLVIIPVQLDGEDVTVALKHGYELTKHGSDVRYLVNRCPARLSKYDNELISRLPREKIIGKLGEVRASRHLRDSDSNSGFCTPSTQVNNAARHLYRCLINHVKLIK